MIKLIKYFFSVVSVLSSNLCEGTSMRIKIYFFLLSTFTEELISTLKIVTLQPNPPLGNENVPFQSNPIPYPEYLYLSLSAFLANLTAPNNFLELGNHYIYDLKSLIKAY